MRGQAKPLVIAIRVSRQGKGCRKVLAAPLGEGLYKYDG
jgi:hypothetical protein